MPPVKQLLAFLLGLILVSIVVVGGLFVAASDGQPLVERNATISPVAVAQARRLIARHDPRRLRKGDSREVAIPAALIDEGLNFAATRALNGRGALVLGKESAELRFTLPLSGDPSPRYLNLTATLLPSEVEPRFAAAHMGSIAIPPALAEAAIAFAFRLFGHEKEWQLARGAIHGLAFESERKLVLVRYTWEPEILDRARAIALDPADLAHLKEAQTALAGMLDHRSPGVPLPLPVVLRPLLQGDDGSLARRRAALAVLATYLAEKNLASVVPDAANWPHPKPMHLTLLGRYDSAQHFVISAALAAWAGEPLAQAIGIYKEMDDARHGSGFSFADLAADRAGTRFGELIAGHDPRLGSSLTGDLRDRDLLPPLAGLPEYLPETEFKRLFGSIGSPAYQRVIGEIERRLDSLPLYRSGAT